MQMHRVLQELQRVLCVVQPLLKRAHHLLRLHARRVSAQRHLPTGASSQQAWLQVRRAALRAGRGVLHFAQARLCGFGAVRVVSVDAAAERVGRSCHACKLRLKVLRLSLERVDISSHLTERSCHPLARDPNRCDALAQF
jgi:hypothetical protein